MATLRELLQLQAVISDDDVYMIVPLDPALRYACTFDLRDKRIVALSEGTPLLDKHYRLCTEDLKVYKWVEVTDIALPTPLSTTHNFYVYKDGKVLEENIKALLALREEKS